MKVGKVALPTATRLQEDTAESGGWSRFFDAVLASLEGDDAGDRPWGRGERDDEPRLARSNG